LPRLLKSFSLFCLQVHNQSFAFFQHEGEFSFARDDRVLAENLVALDMHGGNVTVLVPASF
jgi:hypothetical protein